MSCERVLRLEPSDAWDLDDQLRGSESGNSVDLAKDVKPLISTVSSRIRRTRSRATRVTTVSFPARRFCARLRFSKALRPRSFGSQPGAISWECHRTLLM
jgi:hypothetical protein